MQASEAKRFCVGGRARAVLIPRRVAIRVPDKPELGELHSLCLLDVGGYWAAELRGTTLEGAKAAVSRSSAASAALMMLPCCLICSARLSASFFHSASSRARSRSY